MRHLQAAHFGYSYQDLMCAGRLVDALLRTAMQVTIDRKLVDDDRFDDLTATWSHGLRERVQFKHAATSEPLTLSTFVTDTRRLRLADVVAAAVADRDGPGAGAADHLFRIVMRDSAPVDETLVAALIETESDPGPFLPGMNSHRFRFLADAIWPDRAPTTGVPTLQNRDPWAFLQAGPVSRVDFLWFCNHTILELAAPSATLSLTSPGNAELVVLKRAAEEVGAGVYPNTHRTAVDVVAALVGAAQAARSRGVDPTLSDLLQRTQITHDFGAVARAYVRTEGEVDRSDVVDELMEEAARSADQGKRLLITGAPGQGKSWASELLVERMSEAGWLVADHSCFVGGSDLARDSRVQAEVVFATLAAGLINRDPALADEHRPRYASDEAALAAIVRRSLNERADRRIALVVDGLDHVTRVLGGSWGGDPSKALAQDLALLDLPRGTVLIVISQPGLHLEPFEDARTVELSAWTNQEIDSLAAKLGLFSDQMDPPGTETNAVVTADDETGRAALVEALTDRSGGNPLYATYLCRELIRSGEARANPIDALRAFPSFDGTLQSYYAYLVTSLGAAVTVAEVLGVLDFGVTRAELREIYPDMGHRVDEAIEALAPVLVERIGQGGVRIFHESFARFLLEGFATDPGALEVRLGQVIQWLESKGLFGDSRAFRFLLPMLARAGRDADVLRRVDSEFAGRSVAAGFSATAIVANLAAASASAARLNDWVSLVRCVELTRAASTYESERLDSTVADHADVPIGLLGPDVVAERLLFDGRTTVPSRAGLLLCLAVDRAGGTAPWREYLEAFERDRASDNTRYGEESDRAVRLASLHGQLRLAPSAIAGAPDENGGTADGHDSPRQASEASVADESVQPAAKRLSAWLAGSGLRPMDVIETLADTVGVATVPAVFRALPQENRGPFALAVAEYIRRVPGVAEIVGEARQWAVECVGAGAPLGSAERLLEVGLGPADLPETDRQTVLALSRQMQGESHPSADKALRWLDGIEVLSRVDPLGLTGVEGTVGGPGWYPCWLRFAIAVARLYAERAAGNPATMLLATFRLLAQDTRPFVGTPRACDLFWLHSIIERSIARALALVTDDEWEAVLEVLTRVSDETSTTLMGELGGPLARDVLLGLIYRFTSPSRSPVSRQVVEATLRAHGRFRFYADLAAFELAGARLALLDGDLGQARSHWERAARLLLGYGWRKDITIYDLLDSLPGLAAIDEDEVRNRLSAVQALTVRVVNHTDGSETRHAPARWWELLAAYDPEAAGWTVLQELSRWPNQPQRILEGVRSDLWQSHHAAADPLVASALRLTLSEGRIDDDAQLIERLGTPTESRQGHTTRLPGWIVARWDEQAPIDETADSADGADDPAFRRLNEVAAVVGAHPVTSPVHRPRSSASSHRTWSPSLSEQLSDGMLIDFGRGALGLVRGVREWSRQPFGRYGPRWDVDRLVTAVGYRLAELEAAGRRDEAEAVLRATADALRLGDERRVIASLAEGLEWRGSAELAVLAHVLAFTRARGGGGWLSFGDREHTASLERAWAIDSTSAGRFLADEIGRVIRGPGYGTYGVTRALIQAFALLSGRIDGPNSRLGTPTAFRLWDAAFEVISSRLPPADSRDGPEVTYSPADRTSGNEAQLAPGAGSRFAYGPVPAPRGYTRSLDGALVAATLAALAHPGREQKRRALLASLEMLRARPDLLGSALVVTLPRLDVPTLTWVLSVLLDSERGQSVVMTTAEPLRSLAQSEFLTVRTFARRLLERAGVDHGPVSTEETVEGSLDAPTAPAGVAVRVSDDPSNSASEQQDESQYVGTAGRERALRDATNVVDQACGDRIRRVDRSLAGLRDEVVRRFAERLRSGEIGDRVHAQLDDLVNRAEPRMPDAVTADVEVAEETLQSVAGDVRTLPAMAGVVTADPAAWDGELVAAIQDDPFVPLSLEAARVARPSISRPPTATDSGWREVPSDQLAGFDSSEVRFLVRPTGPLDPTFVSEGPLSGWHVLGLLEQSEPSGRSTDALRTRSVRRAAYEVRSGGAGPPAWVPPMGFGDAMVFRAPTSRIPGRRSLSLRETQPIVGEDQGEGNRGSVITSALGMPAPLLAPSRALVTVLGLVPSEDPYDLALRDELGRAVAIRTWRAGYGSGEYELPRPTLWGTDILIRGDLFSRLQELAGPLVWREHAMLVQL